MKAIVMRFDAQAYYPEHGEDSARITKKDLMPAQVQY